MVSKQLGGKMDKATARAATDFVLREVKFFYEHLEKQGNRVPYLRSLV